MRYLGLSLMLLLSIAPLEVADARAVGEPYEPHCAEPLPVFTLGKNSNPTKAQEIALCACIWKNLGAWARTASEKIVKGQASEVSWLHMRAFPSRFGQVFQKCGGMKL